VAKVQPNVVSYSAAIRSLEGKWAHAHAIFESMLATGIRPDEICTNAILNAYSKAAQWERAFKLLLVTASPDVVSFNTVLSACANGAQWRLACRLLHQLQKESKANCISYNTAISACEKAGNWMMACSLLGEMRHD